MPASSRTVPAVPVTAQYDYAQPARSISSAEARRPQPHHTSSSRVMPTVTEERERPRERERERRRSPQEERSSRRTEREGSSAKKYYGETEDSYQRAKRAKEDPRYKQYDVGNVKYTKDYKPEDVSYTEAKGSRKRDDHQRTDRGFERPQMHRSATMPTYVY
ncbi:hypothetical protein LTS18_014326 [Coniosporium uncinatum]|uniref:Uncharacterized protein n=1 Tax=Coniosporium uncinatum TaxID=93489 RepID=A0ACC3CV53_9PEZI|nr:hypothetical protein LTS18_014326 [Coniosporium uncinatum]